jgi:hypothetical protein
LFVQLTTIYSDLFWFVYLLVPGYAAYAFWPMISGYCCAGGQSEKMDPADLSKKQQKMQAKAEKKEAQEARKRH